MSGMGGKCTLLLYKVFKNAGALSGGERDQLHPMALRDADYLYV